jgi:hypothetical protein
MPTAGLERYRGTDRECRRTREATRDNTVTTDVLSTRSRSSIIREAIDTSAAVGKDEQVES